MQKIILASASPRRKQLLELAKLSFEVIASNAEEVFDPKLLPEEMAESLATHKALSVFESLSAQKNNVVVIGADTIVACDKTILGKPADASQAFEMLSLLSGKTHKVITGICLIKKNKSIKFHVTTTVTFSKLTREQKEFYIAHDKPFDKAGGYAIQEWIGIVGIEKIEGDYYNVMGLPVHRLLTELDRFI